jgi:mono/diheme cytochrome c family protein
MPESAVVRLLGTRPRWKRILLMSAVGLVVLFALIQAVPYGRSHSNPPVTQEPKWDSAQTRALAQRACFDCHSNLTKWRWYSNIAPISWLVQRDVDGGRGTLNFSEWNKPMDSSAGDVADAIRSGSMPPWFYILLHSSAKLSSAEKDALIRGLDATFAASPPKGGGG